MQTANHHQRNRCVEACAQLKQLPDSDCDFSENGCRVLIQGPDSEGSPAIVACSMPQVKGGRAKMKPVNFLGSYTRAEVHAPFLDIFEVFRESLTRNLLNAGYASVLFTGTGFGAPLAILAALSIANASKHHNNHVTPSCLTFGCPKMGNKFFSSAFKEEVPDSLRIVLEGDKTATQIVGMGIGFAENYAMPKLQRMLPVEAKKGWKCLCNALTTDDILADYARTLGAPQEVVDTLDALEGAARGAVRNVVVKGANKGLKVLDSALEESGASDVINTGLQIAQTGVKAVNSGVRISGVGAGMAVSAAEGLVSEGVSRAVQPVKFISGTVKTRVLQPALEQVDLAVDSASAMVDRAEVAAEEAEGKEEEN